MGKKPVVFLIDLDGTIQGNVGPQLQEYELIRTLNRKINHGQKCRYNMNYLRSDMDAGLLRPHFASSLKAIKIKHPHVHFFVYTASTDEWAKFIISKIEKHCFGDLFFERPFLTRKHCLSDYSKSILKHVPLIRDSLKTNISLNRIFLIDNNKVLNDHEESMLIQCPSYDYTHVIDPLRNIGKNTIREYYFEIAECLNINSDRRIVNDIVFMSILYVWLVRLQDNVSVVNGRHSKDIYWRQFARILMSHSLDSDKNVQMVVRTIRHL